MTIEQLDRSGTMVRLSVNDVDCATKRLDHLLLPPRIAPSQLTVGAAAFPSTPGQHTLLGGVSSVYLFSQCAGDTVLAALRALPASAQGGLPNVDALAGVDPAFAASLIVAAHPHLVRHSSLDPEQVTMCDDFATKVNATMRGRLAGLASTNSAGGTSVSRFRGARQRRSITALDSPLTSTSSAESLGAISDSGSVHVGVRPAGSGSSMVVARTASAGDVSAGARGGSAVRFIFGGGGPQQSSLAHAGVRLAELPEQVVEAITGRLVVTRVLSIRESIGQCLQDSEQAVNVGALGGLAPHFAAACGFVSLLVLLKTTVGAPIAVSVRFVVFLLINPVLSRYQLPIWASRASG